MKWCVLVLVFAGLTRGDNAISTNVFNCPELNAQDEIDLDKVCGYYRRSANGGGSVVRVKRNLSRALARDNFTGRNYASPRKMTPSESALFQFVHWKRSAPCFLLTQNYPGKDGACEEDASSPFVTFNIPSAVHWLYNYRLFLSSPCLRYKFNLLSTLVSNTH